MTHADFWKWIKNSEGKPLACSFCEHEHMPEDFDFDDSQPEKTTWQQWQCSYCDGWNDWEPAT